MAVSTAKGLPATDGGYCKAELSWFVSAARDRLVFEPVALEQIRPYQESRQVFLAEQKAGAFAICRACYSSLTEVTILEKARVEGWTDEEVVGRVLSGEVELYEIIMRRYNQRIYRVVISILRAWELRGKTRFRSWVRGVTEW